MKTSTTRSELFLLILFDELQVPIYLDKLKKYGYQNVISCTQGEEAIKKLASGKFSLVITDTELKGKMNGIDLGRKVRQEFNLPLIYLSRLQDETTLDHALETKPRAFLSIPVNWNELRVAIESAMLYNDEVTSLNSVINEFAQWFEEAPLPYQILDGDGRLTSVNKAWVNLMGYSANEVIGKWFGDFMKERFHSVFKQCLDTAKKTGIIHDLECDLIKKDGRSITIAFKGSVQYVLRKEILLIRCILDDITERQKIKENLLESEKRFRILFEEAPLGYQSLAANGGIIYVNNTWCKMLGYSKKEAIGKWFGDFLAPEERKGFIENFSVFRQKGEAYNIKYKMIRKDGEAIYIIIDGIVRCDEGDNYIQAHCILKDITAQKFSEDALLESEKRFRNLIESAGDIIYVLDHDLKYVYGNKQYLKRHGLTQAELIGKEYGDFHSDERKNEFKKEVMTVYEAGNPIFYEYQSETDERYFLRTISPVIDFEANKFESITVISRDITERKMAEEKLQENEERYRRIFEDSPTSIVLTSRDGKFISVNPTFCKMLGYTKKEMSSKTYLDITHPDYLETDGKNVKKMWDGDIPQYRTEKCYITKNGDSRWGNLITTLIRSQDGKPLYALAMIEDITSRKKNEEELQISLEKYRVLFETFPMGISITDKSGQILEANLESERLLGISFDEQIKRRFDSEDWKIVRLDGTLMSSDEFASVRALKENRKVENVEMGIVKNNGVITWINVMAAPIPLENYGVAIAYNDITEKKKIEKELHESRQMLQTVLDTIPAAVFWKDRDLFYLGGNRNFLETVGINSTEEIVGKSDYNLPWNKDQANSFREYDQMIMESGIPEFNIIEPYSRIDGTQAWVKTNKVPLRDAEGNIVGILGTYEDITERKQAEEVLKKNTQLLNDTGEMAQIGGWELDFSTKEVLMTEAVCRIHGVEPGYRLKLEEALNFYLPESRSEVEAVVKKVMETGEPYTLESLFMPRGSKDKIWVRSIGKAVYKGGKVVKLAGTFQNIDKYKKAEETIRNLAKFPAENPDPILRVKRNGLLLFANEASYKLLTWKLQIGKRTPSVLQKVIAEALKEGNREIIDTEHNQRFISFNIVPVLEEGYANLYGRDITERKLIEKALEESEAMLRIINENVSDIIWRIDADARITYISPSVKRLLGYKPEEISGQSILNFIAKEHHHSAANNIRERASKEKRNKLIYYEYEMVTRDGRKVPIEVSSSVIRDDQGNLTGYAGVTRDISERKTAEIALKENEVQYKDLVEKAGVAIIIDDMEGKLIYANREFSRLFGYTMKEINKLTHRDLIHPDDFERVSNIHRRRLLGDRAPASYEFRSIKKNGNFFWTEIKVTILKQDGKFSGTRSYIWDIDKRKKAEKTLKFSEARFRELFSHMSSGVALNEYVSDLDEIVLKDMNEAGFRITKIIDKEKAIGKNILSVFPAANKINLTDDMKKVWRSDKPVQFSSVHYSDDRIDLYIDYYIYKLPSGEIVFVFDNITERISAEQNIWHKYEEIKKLSRHLETVREEERRIIARDLHDDLGQILTAVKMDISWLMNKIPVGRRGIKKRSESAIQIVDLAFQSIRRISSELRPVILDDLGLFETLISHVRDYKNRSKIIVRYKFPKTEPKLKLDKQISVFRIIQEALTNTARHSGASAVDLDILEKDDNLIILIRDNGTGIPDQKLYSSDSFGLISMRERVLQWGGGITIRGKENEGTSISISIPI